MEYHKTKDILHAMQLLGHNNIQNTLLYTHLITFEKNEFHSSAAKAVNEAKQLKKKGFEYVCIHEDVMIFKRRK